VQAVGSSAEEIASMNVVDFVAKVCEFLAAPAPEEQPRASVTLFKNGPICVNLLGSKEAELSFAGRTSSANHSHFRTSTEIGAPLLKWIGETCEFYTREAEQND
jgi:hypothetical protein